MTTESSAHWRNIATIEVADDFAGFGTLVADDPPKFRLERVDAPEGRVRQRLWVDASGGEEDCARHASVVLIALKLDAAAKGGRHFRVIPEDDGIELAS